nr:hypothetical protein [Rhodovulum sulfidophilum]
MAGPADNPDLEIWESEAQAQEAAASAASKASSVASSDSMIEAWRFF